MDSREFLPISKILNSFYDDRVVHFVERIGDVLFSSEDVLEVEKQIRLEIIELEGEKRMSILTIVNMTRN